MATDSSYIFSDRVLPLPVSLTESTSSTESPISATNISPFNSHSTAHYAPSQTLTSQPQRSHKAPSYLNDYHCYLAQKADLSSSSSLSTVLHPISSFLSYHRLHHSYGNFVLSISSHYDPQTFHEANTS